MVPGAQFVRTGRESVRTRVLTENEGRNRIPLRTMSSSLDKSLVNKDFFAQIGDRGKVILSESKIQVSRLDLG
jgi:hypothetical protein